MWACRFSFGHRGEEVLLCWKSDEDEIKFYHGYNDGFKGRKEIP
ncbi:MAG: DUF2203 family protein [Ignavibacteriales bacterium]|nr:DUF2203 family protein [Ignavibacteriales bacterium]